MCLAQGGAEKDPRQRTSAHMYVRIEMEQRCSTNGANAGEDDGTRSKKAVTKKAKKHKQRPVHTHKAEQTQEQKRKQKWQAHEHNQQRTVEEIVNVLVPQVQDGVGEVRVFRDSCRNNW